MPVSIKGTSNLVLQVIQTVKTDVFTTSSTYSGSGFVDVTGMSVTITPSSNTNKILILSAYQVGNSSSNQGAYIRILRGSTSIFTGDDTDGNAFVTTDLRMPNSFNTAGNSFVYLDSPATTSATTYKLQLCAATGGTAYFNATGSVGSNDKNRSKTPASITVMEIAA